MAAASERMKVMRARRGDRGLREVRSVVLDARSLSVQQSIAAQVAALNADDEHAAMKWIEAVSEFDTVSTP